MTVFFFLVVVMLFFGFPNLASSKNALSVDSFARLEERIPFSLTQSDGNFVAVRKTTRREEVIMSCRLLPTFLELCVFLPSP